MTKRVEVRVPDIGDFSGVPVIELLVAPGDRVEIEDPLLTLENDKATMDVPAPAAGVVAELRVELGAEVSEGDVLLVLEPAGADAEAKPEEGRPGPPGAGSAGGAPGPEAEGPEEPEADEIGRAHV